MFPPINIRIEWGSVFTYSPLASHNLNFNWDGSIEVVGGKVLSLQQIEFWGCFGPSRERYVPVEGNWWKSKISLAAGWGYEGVIAGLEARKDSIIKFCLAGKVYEFTPEQLLQSKKLVYHCGSKYSAVDIIIRLAGYDEYDYTKNEIEQEANEQNIFRAMLECADFKGAVSIDTFYRTNYAWIAPGRAAETEFIYKKPVGAGGLPVNGRIKAIICDKNLGESAGNLLWRRMKYEVLVNGEQVLKGQTLFNHFRSCQMVKEIQLAIPAQLLHTGKNVIRIKNLDNSCFLLINRLVLGSSKKTEKNPARTKSTASLITGIDIDTAAPENGEIDFLLEEMVNRNMGRYVLFRTELHYAGEEDWKRWFEFCRTNKIYFSLYELQADPLIYSQEPQNDPLNIQQKIKLAKKYGREFFFGVHHHERSNLTYGWGNAEPLKARQSRSMKDAKNAFVMRMKEDYSFDNAPRIHGEAAPLFHYNYEAGIDICMAETMCGNTTFLLAAARGAARAYQKSLWGVHTACHLHKLPQDEANGVMWSQNLCLSYIYGARVVYDEESLYTMFHGRHWSYYDKLPRDRQNRLIAFNEFVEENPRSGKPRVSFGLLQGNYSCISGGLSCGEQPVKVWGRLGPETDVWSYGPPESGWKLADVFLPGVFLAPIPQRADKLRRWFSGTPYGQCDVLPAGAPEDVLKKYRCLFLWDWNTMTDEIYHNLKDYVESGGCLFLGLPQLSTHTQREFLKGMDDLVLFRDGDFSDFLGFEVAGKGGAVSDIRFLSDSAGDGSFFPEGKQYPVQNNSDETAICSARLKLVDAKVVAECSDGAPALLARQCGRGRVLTLGLWNYPGATAIMEFMRDVARAMAEAHQGDIRLEGSQDINYAVYQDGEQRKVYLLNTDWTEEGRKVKCDLTVGERRLEVEVSQDNVTVVGV